MKNHKTMFSSDSGEWETPQELFDKINAEFGPFRLDVCATAKNTKCREFFSKHDNGLEKTWWGKCWMNPPYGRQIGQWMKKAFDESKRFKGPIVVCLVPARTDTAWWHDYAMNGSIRLLRGRIKFVGAKSGAPFPSAIVVFDSNRELGLMPQQ